ncbi:MAG: hypothetical protein ACK40W_11480 [Allorhizobium sp.]|nr:hypothetical protein [Rhizobium rosettiformans]
MTAAEVFARMLFGKSLFQSVVDRLGAEAEEAPPTEEPTFRINGLSTSFLPETPEQAPTLSEPSADPRLDAYLSLMSDEVAPAEPEPPAEPPPAAPPPPPAWLDRLSPEEIAEDLGLEPSDDRERLQERRRAFARDNHPDRLAEDYRDAATIRMKIANRLIDEAIRRSDLGFGR